MSFMTETRTAVAIVVVAILGIALMTNAALSQTEDTCLSTDTVADYLGVEAVQRDHTGSTRTYSSKCDYSVLPVFSLSTHVSLPKNQQSTWDDWDNLVADARKCKTSCSDGGLDPRNAEGDTFWESPASDYIITTNVSRYGTSAPLVTHRVALLLRDNRICEVTLDRYQIDEESFQSNIRSIEDIASDVCF